MKEEMIQLLTGQQHIKTNQILTSGYENWRANKKDIKGAFFAVFKDINPYLNEFPTGPLKLYIYYGFAADNTTGESWHAVSTIANSLDVAPKTVDNWNSKLEEMGIIVRRNNGKPSKTTYLLPLSDYAQGFNNKLNFTRWVTSPEFVSTFGAITNYYHFVRSTPKNKYENYFVVQVKKDFGTFNQRNIYYYYLDRRLGVTPDIDEDDELDSLLYSLAEHDVIPMIGEMKPKSIFIRDGVDLAKPNEIVEFTNKLSALPTDTDLPEMEWQD